MLKEDLNPSGQPNFCFIDKVVVVTAGGAVTGWLGFSNRFTPDTLELP